jgi:hypothetical protein
MSMPKQSLMSTDQKEKFTCQCIYCRRIIHDYRVAVAIGDLRVEKFECHHRLDVTRLYKYQRFSDRAIQALIDTKVWVSLPEDFNDPFDCQIEVDHRISEEEWMEYVSKIINRPGNAFEEEYRLNYINEFPSVVPSKHYFLVCS